MYDKNLFLFQIQILNVHAHVSVFFDVCPYLDVFGQVLSQIIFSVPDNRYKV